MKPERGMSLRGVVCVGGMLALGLAGLWNAKVNAQEATGEPAPLKLTVRPHMTVADVKGGALRASIQAPQNGVGQRLNGAKDIAKLTKNASQSSSGHGSGLAFYPADLTYQGGPV